MQQDSALQGPLLAAPDVRGNVYQVAGVCAFLLLAVALVFGQTARFGFINLDDPADIYRNPHITGGLNAKAVKWALTERDAATWMPLTRISHMLDCQIYGLSAGGHHRTNVLLHSATVVVVFLVLRQMTGRLWPSALVAAVFAVHPLRAESVAWVTERKDVLSGLFFMLVLGAYVSYASHRFSLVRYATVTVLFALGLMAKPMLVTLPFVLLLLDYWPLERWTARTAARLLLEKVPLLALTVCSCVLTVWAFGSEGRSLLEEQQRFTLSWRIGNATVAYVTYLGMLFYPANLAITYPHPGCDLPLWKLLGSLFVLVVLTWVALATRRRHPYVLVGWLWYLGMLVPPSGILQYAEGTVADRFTYLPQIGLCLALIWGLADALRPWPRLRPACGAAAALLLVVSMLCAWRQTSFWRDNLTLWNHTLACTSRNPVAHESLGNAYLDLGQVDKAIEQHRAALAIEPGHARSHYNLGVALAGAGRIDEAIGEYRKTIELEPHHTGAHNNLGGFLFMQGQLDLAILHFREAIRLDPQFAEAHFNAGNVYYREGAYEQAIEEYQQALKIDPHLVRIRYALGLALAKRGRPDEAISAYRKALETKPEFAADVHNSLGLALVACGRRDEAVIEYRNALAIRPDFAKARLNLGRVLTTGK